MPNKIVDKYLAPYRLGAAGAIAAVIIAGNTMGKLHRTNMDMVNKHYVGSVDASAYFAAGLGLAIAIYLLTMGLYSKPKQAKQFATNAVTQYLNKIFSETPQIEHYFHVLYNPKCVKIICDFVCNALPKDKRAEILKIVKDMEHSNEKNIGHDKAVQMAIEKIVKIVKDYANANPDFMYGVNDIIAYSYTTYVMSDEHTR